jgi:beta-lactamase regulating signal transducer with metallopeptidase domain
MVLVITALAVCGPLTCVVGVWPRVARWPASGIDAERVAWRRLWVALCPAALVVAMLVGWALREPDPSDERVHAMLAVAAVPSALVCVRAMVRAVLSLASRERPLAATAGVLRPRVYIAPRLEQALDVAALSAAREHEAAHARHRDPLRLWLAQLAADLQWPSSAAARRFADWRHALELARDEEARARGVDGADLADAILTTARTASSGGVVAAGLTGDATRLRERIRRLLEPLSQPARSCATGRELAVVAVLFGAALAMGMAQGEVLIRLIPGVQP